MKHRSDEELIRECLNGNEGAWHALIDRYKSLIYSVPVRYRIPPQDAADIFQGVCIELYNELPKLREAGALRRWLITVAGHQCFHWKRRRQTRPEHNDEEELNNLAMDPEPALVEELQQLQLLRDAMEQLPPRCRKMIELLFFQDPPIPYAEVASRLGLATGSIGFIRGRCLAKMRKILEEQGF